ncbi:MAG: hypothetical protein CMD07_06030 [Flavobacteriales bacterium]|nr:hypothetical protein [Flavobacteriales bacterium]|tara:strand:+ start:6053 stop:6496 length:444 start_codon:yes stop_codon:yes gene_type:complete
MYLIKKLILYIYSIFYIYIGIKHFINSNFFYLIIPPFIPFKNFIIYFTGIIEITGGLLIIFKKFRTFGSYIIIFLLIIVFPANIYIVVSKNIQEVVNLSFSGSLIRSFFQIPLILVASWFRYDKMNNFAELFYVIISIITIIYFLTL